MIPLGITPQFCKALQKLCGTYIWSGKRPRVSLALLQTAPRLGGVGLPNLRQYHRAAILSTGILLHAPPGTLQWVDMERTQFTVISLTDYLWTPRKFRTKHTDLFPTTQLTISIWDTFMETIGHKDTLHTKSPISVLRTIVPNTPLKDWNTAGVTKISQLLDAKGIIPFPALQTQWQLPNRAIFSYLQLKSAIQAHTPSLHKPPDATRLTSYLLLDRCWATPTKPKTLTLCYKAWQELSTTTSHPYKLHWETDCGTVLTDRDWLCALNGLSKWTKCYTHVEAHKKLLYRWYMTPQRLYRIYPNTPNTCWRCNATTGTLEHLWWSCGSIQPLWTAVSTTLDQLHIPKFQLSKPSCLLLLLPANLTLAQKQIAALTILAARNLLALHWKSQTCPSLAQLQTKLTQYKIYERMAIVSPQKKLAFDVSWGDWEGEVDETGGIPRRKM
ncbi:Hypothetical predicted protein [Pelobates cultripes]|uniref:Reverse transcriptase zinc-binding domain-containing protein n=1 Tax=Pelobates cultripes TaxID=61616 RepID=A0AAD1RLI1_PELCU|nr:Hypothetical predicted protein [Pelobates cultripes]